MKLASEFRIVSVLTRVRMNELRKAAERGQSRVYSLAPRRLKREIISACSILAFICFLAGRASISCANIKAVLPSLSLVLMFAPRSSKNLTALKCP